MLLFSINRSRGYENPSLDIIVIELYSTGGFPLEEAREHCFQIQSVIYVVILISFQCYCGECSGYIVVILPLLAFYFSYAYFLYLVYYIFTIPSTFHGPAIGNHDLEIIDCTNIAINFLGNAVMNKTIGASTINKNDELPMLDVANYLEGLGRRETSERI
jgi:hypothetical protein